MQALLMALLIALVPAASAADADVLVSALLAKPVQTPQGRPLGEIAGVLLQTRPNDVSYADLAYRDAAGEEKRFAYPINAFRLEGHALVLNVPAAHLEKSAELTLANERHVSAAKVLGRPVDDRLGNTVGRLEDVLVNLDSGRTRSFLIVFAEQPDAPLQLSAHLLQLQVAGNPILHADPDRRAALGAAFR